MTNTKNIGSNEGVAPIRSGLTEFQQELLKMPTIGSQMPVSFEDTEFSVQQFMTSCGCCKSAIGGEHVHGSITRPMPVVAVVEAVAICPQCNAATQVKTRFHSDHRITFLSRTGWVVMEARAPSFMDKLGHLFFGGLRAKFGK